MKKIGQIAQRNIGKRNYNATSQSWEFLTDMNYGRASHAMAAVNGAIWVIGSDTGSEAFKTEYINSDGSVISGPDLDTSVA